MYKIKMVIIEKRRKILFLIMRDGDDILKQDNIKTFNKTADISHPLRIRDNHGRDKIKILVHHDR